MPFHTFKYCLKTQPFKNQFLTNDHPVLDGINFCGPETLGSYMSVVFRNVKW